MKKIWELITVSLLILFSVKVSADVLAQVYRDDYNQFAIALPNEKWKWDSSIHSTHVKVKIVYFQSIDQFVPNMSVSISQREDQSSTLKELVQKSIEEYPKQLKIKSQKSVKANGFDAYDLELIDEKNLISIQQRFFIQKEKFFVLTFAARQSSMERLLNDFQKMLTSFTLEKGSGDTL